MSLKELSDKLGKPGALKLFLAAKKQGLDVTKKQVEEFVKSQSERQVFQRLQRSQGKTIAGDTSDRWQMDLIDLKQDPAINKLGEQDKNILVLINVFDRSLYAMPLTGKDVKTVRGALIKLLDQLREKPKIISVDAGKEFEGRVASFMVQRGITFKTKAMGDKMPSVS